MNFGKLLFFICIVMPLSLQANPFFRLLPRAKVFSTFSDFEQYAHVLPEYPLVDNDDYVQPDYTSFYKTLTPGFFKKTWSAMRNVWPSKKIGASWSPDVLKSLLETMTDLRKMRSYQGNFIEKFTPSVDAKFVMWGNLHGSYHSFIRGLRELRNQEIINDQLKIVKPEHYFVFNGNAIDLSPFSMETLTCILLLMKQNPQNVFYVRGVHEAKNRWHKYGLRQELQAKVKQTKDFVAFESLFSDFFNTLPLALYLRKRTGKMTQFVQVSNLNNVHHITSIPACKDFLHKYDQHAIQIFKITAPIVQDDRSNLLVADLAFVTDNDTHSLSGMRGIKKSDEESDRTIWKLFSSPSRVQHMSRQYFYDSFVVFSLSDVLSKSTIALYSRDTRGKGAFEKMAYNAFVPAEQKENKMFDSILVYDQEIKSLQQRLGKLEHEKHELVSKHNVA